jgi:hypothetical protein
MVFWHDLIITTLAFKKKEGGGHWVANWGVQFEVIRRTMKFSE